MTKGKIVDEGGCGLNAWAKPDAPPSCGDSKQPMSEEPPEDAED